MPLPDLGLFCQTLAVDDCVKSPGLSIRMPGGIRINVPGGSMPLPLEQAGKMLGALNGALAPFGPIFDVIDCLTIVLKVIKNPLKILDLVKAVEKLAGLVPTLSVPVMVKDILHVISCLLNALEDELSVLHDAAARLAAAELKLSVAPVQIPSAFPGVAYSAQASGRAGISLAGYGGPKPVPESVQAQLRVASGCGAESLQFKFDSMMAGLGPLNELLGLLSSLLALAGIDALPSLETGGASGAVNLTAALGVIVTAIDVLKTSLIVVQDALPG